MKILIIASLLFSIRPAMAQELWADASESFAPGFQALNRRVEMEHAQRVGFQNAPLSVPAETDADVLKACPEIDARFFARRSLPQAVASVQACLDRVYGPLASDVFSVEARPGMLLSDHCPAARGMVHCASLTETQGILIVVRGRSAVAARAASDLQYAVNVERAGKLEDWDASVEAVR